MIDRLDMFIALAQERHFGRAARRLGIAQPSLSSAIRALEESLGVQLVLRGSRFLGLTPEGEQVYRRALGISAGLQALKDEMRAAREGLSGVMRIGVIPTALPVVPRLTLPFSRRHPGLRLSILSRSSAEILEGLDENRLDAGISYLDATALARCDCLGLSSELYALLLRQDHPLAGAQSLVWADLAGIPLCLLGPEMQNRRIVDAHLAGAGVQTVPAIEANSAVALAAHVLAGGPASVMALELAGMFTGAGLVAVPIRDGRAETVGLLAARQEHPRPAVEALFDLARKQAR